MEHQVDISFAQPVAEQDLAACREDSPAIELGVWLSGVESFLSPGGPSFADNQVKTRTADMTKELRLTHSALLRCALLVASILSLKATSEDKDAASAHKFSNLADVLRDLILIGDQITRSGHVDTHQWKAWCNSVVDRLSHCTIYKELIRAAEEAGTQFLPRQLKDLADGSRELSDHAELALVVPRFGKTLLWLNVVGKMLAADEPLKPALLIFSAVSEQIRDLIGYINSCLERFPDKEVEMFHSLDAAAYTASIELKKIHNQELLALAQVRPAQSIYARMETAYALLNDGFQQILVGFAKSLDPHANAFDLFPGFKSKFEQSLVLRRDLNSLTRLAWAAEEDPSKSNVERLHDALHEFMKQTVRYLFYKDNETVERFVEEILVTKDSKDLIPILHRFGAYLETLFGQVNLRAGLENNPFEFPEK
jgi:hypothetical protein